MTTNSGESGDGRSSSTGEGGRVPESLEQVPREPANDEIPAKSVPRDVSITSMALEMVQARGRRSKFFDASMFGGEGAWDILLTLFVADLKGRGLSRDELAAAVGLSETTMARWVKYLEGLGLVCGSVESPAVSFGVIRLSERAHLTLNRYFAVLVQERDGA